MAFDAKEDKIVKLLSQNLLEIPRNQRKYVWTKVNWSDLISDIKFIVDNPTQTEHFLGSIVLRSEETINGLERFSIIDGQQRTITIILFLLSLIRVFQENNRIEDVEGTLQFIYFKDRKNNERLVMHSDDHILLADIASNIKNYNANESFAQLISKITFKDSEKKIKEGIEHIYSTLKSYVDSYGIEYVIKIKDSLLDARYIRIIADSDADAYTVFEILNARGMSLEDYELLKNYIMRYIQPKEKVDEVKAKWTEIEHKLKTHIKAFFRHYVIHKIGAGSSDVYLTIKNKFKKENVSDLLNDLYRKSALYELIIYPNQNRHKEEFQILSFLKSRRSQQLRPLLLSLISSYEAGRIDQIAYLDLLQFLRNFFICFTIIASEKSNKLTEIVEKYAPMLENHPSKENLDLFKDAMRHKLPTLETFTRIFSELGYSNHYEYYKDSAKKNQVLVALELIESHLSPGFSYEDVTIEHLNPDCESRENATIGNLTLLEESINQKCGSLPFRDKLPLYGDSNFRMTREIQKRYSSDPDKFNIESRAKAMAQMIYSNIFRFKIE